MTPAQVVLNLTGSDTLETVYDRIRPRRALRIPYDAGRLYARLIGILTREECEHLSARIPGQILYIPVKADAFGVRPTAGRKKTDTSERDEKIFTMRDADERIVDIARHMNLSITTIRTILRGRNDG